MVSSKHFGMTTAMSLTLFIASLFQPSSAQAGKSAGQNGDTSFSKDSAVVLGEVLVLGKTVQLVGKKGTQPIQGSTITRKGIELLGGPAQASVNNTIGLLPSVSLEPIDPYGLNRALQNNLIRIRGQGNDPVSYTLDGVPLGTGTRFGPRENSFDMENFSDITLYRGAAPADRGFGFANCAGSVDIRTLPPADTAGFIIVENVGMNDFSKTFVRGNTGPLFSGFKSFASFSYATSDKWRGAGGVDRKHAAFGADFPLFSAAASGRLFVDYQRLRSNNYYALTYDQTRNVANYTMDFNASLTGDSSKDVCYYKFNRIEDEYFLLHAEIRIRPAGNHTVSIKPYGAYDAIENFDATKFSGVPAVYDWKSKRTRFGGIVEYTTRVFNTDLSAGYWMEMFRWPTFARKAYTVDRSGNLSFLGWAKQLLTYDGYFKFDSPYLMLATAIGNVKIDAAVKYLLYRQPAATVYKNAGVPDVAQENFSEYATRDTNACVLSKSTGALLPGIAASCAINDHIAPYFKYGRGYGIAYFGPGGIISGYWSNRSYFDGNGITADELADEQKIPVADNLDLGVTLAFGSWHITPNAFYSRYHNASVSMYDPATTIYYRQTVGKADAYGGEMEVSGSIVGGLSLFASGTYDRTRYRENIRSNSDSSDIRGNQFPDCPKYLAKLGVVYRPSLLPGLEIAPVARYVGTRYGDITNKEMVWDYSTGDINVSYGVTLHSWVKSLSIGVSVLNVVNKKYIASINASDENRAPVNGSSSAGYYPGSPRTVTGSVTMAF